MPSRRSPRAIASARLRSSSTTSTRIPASSLLTTDNLVPAGNPSSLAARAGRRCGPPRRTRCWPAAPNDGRTGMTTAAPPTRRDIAYRGFHLPADARQRQRRRPAAPTVEGSTSTASPSGAPGRRRRYLSASPSREVVPSWTADTPDGCWIEVELRGWHDDAPSTDWYRLARWAADDHTVRRTSRARTARQCRPGRHRHPARDRSDGSPVGRRG